MQANCHEFHEFYRMVLVVLFTICDLKDILVWKSIFISTNQCQPTKIIPLKWTYKIYVECLV